MNSLFFILSFCFVVERNRYKKDFFTQPHIEKIFCRDKLERELDNFKNVPPLILTAAIALVVSLKKAWLLSTFSDTKQQNTN